MRAPASPPRAKASNVNAVLGLTVLRASGINDLGQSFAENLPRTEFVVPPKLPRVQAQFDSDSMPRQVGDGTLVAAPVSSSKAAGTEDRGRAVERLARLA